jgi:hypothetical protein
VAGERQLTGRGEDPQPVVGGRVARLEEERRLGQVRPAGDRRHRRIVELVGAGHDGDRIAHERLGGEHVDLGELQTAHPQTLRQPGAGWTP